jgi:CheY-like chemotaxis protein
MSEPRRRRILLIDDDPSVHLALKHVLKVHYDCLSAHDGSDARI